MINIAVSVFVWWAIGAASFVFWWTKQYDFRSEEIGLMCAAGLLGPFAFIAGWSIHGNWKVIIRRRGEKCEN
jgi:hypothetical protein